MPEWGGGSQGVRAAPGHPRPPISRRCNHQMELPRHPGGAAQNPVETLISLISL